MQGPEDDAGLSGKWLAMLKEVSPRLKRAVLMIDPKTTPLEYFYRPAEAVAKRGHGDRTRPPAESH